MPKARGINRKHDWAAHKAEFILGHETLAAFSVRKDISYHMVYDHAADEGWLEARQEVVERAMEKVKTAAVGTRVGEWDKYLSLMDAVAAHAAHLLRKGVGPDGRITMSLEAVELSALTSAIDKAVKVKRLIMGESTENIATRNLHMDMVRMLQDQKLEDEPIVGDQEKSNG